MIFIDIRLNNYENGNKEYRIKYSTLDDLYLFLKKDNLKIPFKDFSISVNKYGMIDNEENLSVYKELFYEVGSRKVIVDNKESGNLLLNLSNETPKELPISKITIFEDMFNEFSSLVTKSNNEEDIDLLNKFDLKDKYKEVVNEKDSFIKMIKSYKYGFHNYITSISNYISISEAKKDILDMFEVLSSNPSLGRDRSVIDNSIKTLEDTKVKLAELSELKFDVWEKYEHDFTYFNSSIFNDEGLCPYVPF